jgi:TATA-box binding protein (TBP) (component of TFIID and TFIIIB)
MNNTKKIINIPKIKLDDEKLRIYLRESFQKDKKPDEIKISTITINCKLNMQIFCDNIKKYITHGDNNIRLMFNKKIKRVSSTINNKITKKNNAYDIPKIKKFQNQVSLVIYLNEHKKVNFKIFSNGSITITGCKNMDDPIDGIFILVKKLTEVKSIYNTQKNIFEDKPFAIINNNDLDLIMSLKINMINSDFRFPVGISRSKLYYLMKKDNYNCTVRTNHQCVNIKFPVDGKDITIFVFEKGSIVITAATNCYHLSEAYTFINTYLLENIMDVIQYDNMII